MLYPYLYPCFLADGQDQEIDAEFELLVLASDGLWDVVPNEVPFRFEDLKSRLEIFYYIWMST
ncbi:hypothetical protein CsSME_00001894 [Camellia sinensis var. sinensis]